MCVYVCVCVSSDAHATQCTWEIRENFWSSSTGGPGDETQVVTSECKVCSYLCHLACPSHNFVTDHWTVTSSKSGWKIPSWSPRKLTRLTRPRQLRKSQDSGGPSKVMWAANTSWGRWHSSGELPASWAGSSRDAVFGHQHPCSCLKVTRAAV